MRSDWKEELYRLSAARAATTVWLISDVQRTDMDEMKYRLDLAGRDVRSLDLHPDKIIHLGDAVQGRDDPARLRAMAKEQAAWLDTFGTPVLFVLGNHDLDLTEAPDGKAVPAAFFRDEVLKRPAWQTTEKISDACFRAEVGGFVLYCFSDCMAEDGAWRARFGEVQGETEKCPYNEDFYAALRERIAAEERPVITVSHYAYVGGARPSARMSKLMPLPANVRLHFHGHAHIGALDVCYESAFRRLGWVDWHDVPEINVSSLSGEEDGSCIRSVILHLYEDGTAGIFFRDHSKGQFEECFFPSPENRAEGLSAYLSTHPGFRWYK